MTTTTVPADHVTARVLLFGDADSEGELQRLLDEQGVARTVGAALGVLSRGGREAAASQVAAVTRGLMDLELDDLLFQGWMTHSALIAAAHRTVGAPGSREVVQLATHRVTSQREFHVDVLLDRAYVMRVHILLSAEFLIESLVGVVTDGRLIDACGGDCWVTVTLSAEGKQLAHRKEGLPLPGRLRLGGGLDLLSRRVPVQPAG